MHSGTSYHVRRGPARRLAAPRIPTAIHSVRGAVTEFEEPHGNYRRCAFEFHKQRGCHAFASEPVSREPAIAGKPSPAVCPSGSRSERPMWSKDAAAKMAHLRVFSRYVVLPGGERINLGGRFRAVRRRRGPAARGTAAKTGPKSAENAAPSGPKKLWPAAERLASAAVDGQTPGEAPQPLTLNHPASNPGRISGRGSSFWRHRGRNPQSAVAFTVH